ncbi:unnamed protein product, partial [Heterotrigona itama]
LSRTINSESATGSEHRITNFSYVLQSVTLSRPCILANMTITIKVPYKTQENKIDYISLKVPQNATIEGHCSIVISDMKLTWKDGKAKPNDKENSIKFTFINDHTNFSLFSIDLNIYRDEGNFKNATDVKQWFNATSDKDLYLFVASVKNEIHRCNNETIQKVGEGEIHMNSVSLIAFNRDYDLSSRQENKCSRKTGTKTFPYVTSSGDKYCTMARMSIFMEVPYKTKNDTKIASITVPTFASKVNVNGGCSANLVMMQLIWPVSSNNSQANANEKQNSISFLFFKNETTSTIYNIKIEIFTDETQFKDVEKVGEKIVIDTGFDASLFPAPAENGIYSCPNETKITNDNGNVTISDVLLVAFDAEKDFSSKKVIDCRGFLFEDDFNYIIKEKDTNIPCTVANMSITATLHKDGQELHVPSNAVATGICKAKYSQMTLSWPSNTNATNSITFHIGQNKTHFFVFQIAAAIYDDKNKKMINGESYIGIDLFSAAATNGFYRCPNSIDTELDDIRLTITDVVFIAFYTDENIYSPKVTECPKLDPNSTTSTVPSSPTTEPIPTNATVSSLPTIEPNSTISTVSSSPATEPNPTISTISSSSATEPNPTISTISSSFATEPEPNHNAIDYNYFVTSAPNVYCIAANMSISIEIPYKTKEDKDTKATLNVPINATVTGKCENQWSTMELNWTASSNNTENNTFTVNFEKDDSNYFISSMNLSIYPEDHHFPGHDTTDRYKFNTERIHIFPAPLNKLYKCADNPSVTAKNAKISITNVTLIAFNTNEKITTDSVNCVPANDTTESNVGAIVGGIIGGLIVLVALIALFVVCRRRRGY